MVIFSFNFLRLMVVLVTSRDIWEGIVIPGLDKPDGQFWCLCCSALLTVLPQRPLMSLTLLKHPPYADPQER